MSQILHVLSCARVTFMSTQLLKLFHGKQKGPVPSCWFQFDPGSDGLHLWWMASYFLITCFPGFSSIGKSAEMMGLAWGLLSDGFGMGNRTIHFLLRFLIMSQVQKTLHCLQSLWQVREIQFLNCIWLLLLQLVFCYLNVFSAIW